MRTTNDPASLPLRIQTVAAGASGGSSYSYRGATVQCPPGDHVCNFNMDGHPLSGGGTFGVAGTITPLIAYWLEHEALPPYRQPR
ncbi:hypothetical protein [Paracraurococcus lichenis]|uniref:Uncharacterized protein n=1 Tax=Paracraurococcus lichenis TaxID=3064888 RepID=A0ABT9E984_9PROT|nr:hypothetical protein [Paracraurococcus sp. LOR1-02]MDO9712761.1 hypothetical protein [Paracraurococcus sp. LOR1-02]